MGAAYLQLTLSKNVKNAPVKKPQNYPYNLVICH